MSLRDILDAIHDACVEDAKWWDEQIAKILASGLGLYDLVLVDDRDKRECRLEQRSTGRVLIVSRQLSLLPDGETPSFTTKGGLGSGKPST